MNVIAISVVLLTFNLFQVICNEESTYNLTYDMLYSEGITAYGDANWYQCSRFLQDAIDDYKFFKKTTINCRLACKNETGAENNTINMVMMNILSKAECIRKCKSSKFGDRPHGKSNDEIENAFKNRKPYEYLQFCLYKIGKVVDAASAAYTYYVVNSQERDAIRNVQYYRDKGGVADSDFLDMELQPYKEHYVRATMAYEDESWEEVVDEIESGLKEFYEEEKRCRSECEGPLLNSSPLEFYSSVAQQFTAMVKCQYDCELKLSSVFPDGADNLLAEHYHYLQYAYYKVLQADKASEAAATYLLFKPEDEVMLKNKAFFIREGYEDTHQPRPEAVRYLKMREELQEMVKYCEEHLITADYHEIERENRSEELEEQVVENWMQKYEDIGLKIVANGNHLNGSKRFATDGFLKEEQCSAITYIVEDYFDNENGSRIISIDDIFKKVGEKEEELELSLRLMLRMSEVSRHYTMKYYNLTSLYFKKTNLVCWSINVEAQLNKTCLPQEDGSCIEDMSQVPNDKGYMSIMYLQDLPGNGDLNFLQPNNSVSRNVSSKCGRLVGMTRNEYYNVSIPRDTMRCAAVIHYTESRKEEEKAYIETIIALQVMEDEKRALAKKNNVQVLQEFEKNGTTVTQNSGDLYNNTAFVADGLLQDNDCSRLQQLVEINGGMGDGYTSIHPHTEKELFSGLNLHHLSELAYFGQVKAEEVALFLEISERGRLIVEKYFNLTRPLYFDFTHLVCRTAVSEDGKEERDDLSHPVHADNCILQPDGSCIKSFPAFTQRDFSAIIYLNKEFEGGDFFFAHSNKSEQVSVKPKCGRIVGFDSKEFHGVKPVIKGKRCALALWFTLNPNYKELAHVHARKVLNKIREGGIQPKVDEKPIQEKKDATDTKIEDPENTDDSENNNIKPQDSEESIDDPVEKPLEDEKTNQDNKDATDKKENPDEIDDSENSDIKPENSEKVSTDDPVEKPLEDVVPVVSDLDSSESDLVVDPTVDGESYKSSINDDPNPPMSEIRLEPVIDISVKVKKSPVNPSSDSLLSDKEDKHNREDL